MQKGHLHTYGQFPLFESIGIIAKKAENDYTSDLGGLAEWLNRSNITGPGDISEMSPSYFKTLIESYVSDHNSTAFGPIFPTFSDLSLVKETQTVEVADIVVAAAISTPLLEMVKKKIK